MKDQFLDIIIKAEEFNWCLTPYCTTCGNTPFGEEIKRICGGDLFANLPLFLKDIDLDKFTKSKRCYEVLKLIIIQVKFPFFWKDVLESWYPKISHYVRLADVVLYYLIKNFSKESEIRKLWIDKCIDMAIKFEDESLVESLILVLKKDMKKNNTIYTLANNMSVNSIKIKKVLKKYVV